jgi:ribosomal protein S6
LKIYEGMFLVDSRKANRDWDSVLAHVSGILQKSGATIHRINKWAERKLAYPIKKQTRGVYMLAYFETPDQEGIITEIYRQAEISDTILRVLILRVKEVPQEVVPAPASEEGEKQERPRARESAAAVGGTAEEGPQEVRVTSGPSAPSAEADAGKTEGEEEG